MRITVKLKLFMSFFFVAVLLAVTSGISFFYLKKVNTTYSGLVTQQAQIAVNTSMIQFYADHEVSLLREYFLMHASDDISGIQDDGKSIDTLLKQTSSLTTDSEVKSKLYQVQVLNQDYQSQVSQLSTMGMDTGLQFANKQNLFEFGVNIKDKVHAVQVQAQSELTSKDLSTTQLTSRILTTVLILSIVAIVFAFAVGYFVSRSLSKPLSAMARLATSIAEGDLTENHLNFRNRDEIGVLASAFNHMLTNLRHLITEIHLNADQLAASAEELTASAEQTSDATQSIAVTTQELASGAEKQADNLAQTSRTVQELTVSTQDIASNAGHVANAAQTASQLSDSGAASIKTSIEQMQSIQWNADNLATAVRTLGDRSQEIEQIVQTITEISAQTNLLALNAAIEAARAGEHGKGFAVVADEVRKLAEQSTTSAQQIQQIVGHIQEDTQHAISVTETTTHEVSEGIRVVHEAGDSFAQIRQAITSVVEQIEQVSGAVQQIAAGSQQMAATVEEVAQVSHETATGSENVSAAAEEQLATMEEVTASANSLATMAENLQELVKQFRV